MQGSSVELSRALIQTQSPGQLHRPIKQAVHTSGRAYTTRSVSFFSAKCNRMYPTKSRRLDIACLNSSFRNEFSNASKFLSILKRAKRFLENRSKGNFVGILLRTQRKKTSTNKLFVCLFGLLGSSKSKFSANLAPNRLMILPINTTVTSLFRLKHQSARLISTHINFTFRSVRHSRRLHSEHRKPG